MADTYQKSRVEKQSGIGDQYIKIAKLEPQPKDGIHSSGFEKDKGFGVWDGVLEEDFAFGGECLCPGRFISCPVDVSFRQFWTREIDFDKIGGEWWWIKRI